MNECSITFLGHTTVWLKTSDISLVIDPNFDKKMFYLRRLDDPSINTEDLHKVNCVLLSNAHHHRMNLDALRYFKQTAQIILPMGLGRIISRFHRFPINELKNGAEMGIGSCQIIGLKPLHRGFRNCPLIPQNSLHYIIKLPTATVFYCSDTKYDGACFFDIGKNYNIDVAILPIDHLNPDFIAGKRYMTPAEAVQAFKDLGAKKMIPNAFGSFNYHGRTFEKISETLSQEMTKQGVTSEVCLLRPGEKIDLKLPT
ncbi:MAG: MBL fold metallo-hydrolase [Deltaproteobacteria bacterium]|nr:MBL fold metallo-hydrolase [Deltaproteobacteria bacterium]